MKILFCYIYINVAYLSPNISNATTNNNSNNQCSFYKENHFFQRKKNEDDNYTNRNIDNTNDDALRINNNKFSQGLPSFYLPLCAT